MSWVSSRIKWVKLPETTDITQVMVDSGEEKTARPVWPRRVFIGGLVVVSLVLVTLLVYCKMRPTERPDHEEWTLPVDNIQVEYAGRACGDTRDCARGAEQLSVTTRGSLANFFLGGDGNIYPNRGWHQPVLLDNRTSYLMLLMGDWSHYETPRTETGALHRVIHEGLMLGYLDERWSLSHESKVSHSLRRVINSWRQHKNQQGHHRHGISLNLNDLSPSQPNATAHPH